MNTECLLWVTCCYGSENLEKTHFCLPAVWTLGEGDRKYVNKWAVCQVYEKVLHVLGKWIKQKDWKKCSVCSSVKSILMFTVL